MTPMTKEALAQLRLKAERATKGEWWFDSIENEGTYGAGDDCVEGFTSYVVCDESDRILLDTLNSTAACIQEEYDGECHVAWDEVGQRNAEFIAAANPTTVMTLLDALEAKDKRIAEQREYFEGVIADGGKRISELQSRAESAELALLLERQKGTEVLDSLKLLEAEISERFDMDDKKTNPGIKIAVERAQSAIAGVTLQIQGGE